MQALIGEVVRVLGEQTDGASYALPLAELAQIIAARGRSVAADAAVNFELRLEVNGALANRNANLVLLILENLVRNAVEASPRNKVVCLAIGPANGGVVCEVADQGPGLSEAVRQSLFLPCRSTKPGGNGIGLALSQQLARHLGAQLKLVRSTAAGSVFALALPEELIVDGHAVVHQPANRLPIQT
jgi:signal transduction histidine kinase